jgi:hypothetical protein
MEKIQRRMDTTIEWVSHPRVRKLNVINALTLLKEFGNVKKILAAKVINIEIDNKYSKSR